MVLTVWFMKTQLRCYGSCWGDVCLAKSNGDVATVYRTGSGE